MRALFFGSGAATVRWLPVIEAVTRHAVLDHTNLPPLDMDLMHRLMVGDLEGWPVIAEPEPLVFIHGAGPARKPEAIGLDKLSEVGVFYTWPEGRRAARRFPVEQRPGEEWRHAAKRRNADMVAARPHRAYCVHTDLDASKGSSMTASFLTAAGIPFAYVKVSQAGALVSVEQR